ncbi:Putative gluconeogenesis factor [Geodia barretti]|uniref:Gluconeogenesis factor n=1 Tax=Geodia barretti TaxID=519541 RepID=A0AA35X7S5_GEOBA|nr:Putative gluconeogenesis factor [Geodia barretti]
MALNRLISDRARDWGRLPFRNGHKALESGPRITVIGGGTGLPSLIRGIKYYSHNITAIVTMADDGGSSGRLRSELGIQPPGDIRNCLVALADSEDVMQKLMDYRFSSDGQLNGHSFGNMLIAALAEIGGDFSRAVEIAGELLAIRGRAHPEAVAALKDADLVIIGPGSLYTSIVPNLLIPGIANAVAESKALKDHADVVRRYTGPESLHAVIANSNIPDAPTPAGLDFIKPERPWNDGTLLIEADILDQEATARHDPRKLALTVAETYRRHRGKRRRLPRATPTSAVYGTGERSLQSQALCGD